MRRALASSFLMVACLATGLAQSADWRLDVAGQGFTRGQAPDPAQAEYAVPWRQHILLDEAGRWRYERLTTFPGEITFHYLEMGNPQGYKSVDVAGWRNGTETLIQGAQESRVVYADLLLYGPAILLKISRELSPQDAQGVQTLVDPAGRTLRLQRNAAGDIAEVQEGAQRYIYTDWADVGGLRQPGRVQLLRGERLLRDVAVTLQPASITDADMQLPPGYGEALARTGLRVVPVAGDLYRLEGSRSAYHMAFAVGSEGIVLFDTPRSKEEGEAMRRVITAAFPGKVVTDIVYSHGHIDHQAGLSPWLDMKPQIWTGVGGRAALVRHVAEAANAQVQEIGAARELVRGHLRFKLLPVRSSHAHDMLVTLFPAARAVLQGDLFMVPDQGPVAAYSTAEHLQQILRAAKFEAEHIISVHGRVASAADLAVSVRLQQAKGAKGKPKAG